MKVTGIIEETADTRSFILEPVGITLPCRSGQFFTFIFTSSTGRELRRSYSISSSPELGEPITVTIKRITNGEVSRMIFSEVRVGSELITIGASGFFVLPENMQQCERIVFMAAGSGITPVLSLMKTVLQLHQQTKVLLIYSNSSKRQMLFGAQLQALERQYSGSLTIHYLFSNAKDIRRSRLTPELLSQILEHERITAFGKTFFYICGPGGYMRMVNFSLLHQGVPAARIKREIFHVQSPAAVPAPPDTEAHLVQLQVLDEVYTFSVQYPVTILQAAKLAHVPLPYSCETGQCGSCVAKCLQGEVWMSRNEVLLEEEIRQGIVLTCTGYPVHGDIVLQR